MYEFLPVVTLRAVYESRGEGHLPEYLGSTVRGIIGHCFRDFVCDTPGLKCLDCERKDNCSFVQNFSNTGGKGGAINPFVLYVHTQGRTEWKTGDECIFDQTLFGHAALQPHIYLDALQKMEKKGWGAERIPFSIKRVCDYDNGTLLLAGKQSWLRNLTPHSMIIQERNAGTVLVVFDTPTRIVSGKKLFSSLPFSTLIQFILRRFLLVTQVCTGRETAWEGDSVFREAEAVKIVEEEWKTVNFSRYSMNQTGNKLELPGQKGWVLYEGDLSQFVPILEAGKYLHVGKNSTIGFGHYQLFYEGKIKAFP